jgi:hypothetical protein
LVEDVEVKVSVSVVVETYGVAAAAFVGNAALAGDLAEGAVLLVQI